MDFLRKRSKEVRKKVGKEESDQERKIERLKDKEKERHISYCIWRDRRVMGNKA